MYTLTEITGLVIVTDSDSVYNVVTKALKETLLKTQNIKMTKGLRRYQQSLLAIIEASEGLTIEWVKF